MIEAAEKKAGEAEGRIWLETLEAYDGLVSNLRDRDDRPYRCLHCQSAVLRDVRATIGKDRLDQGLAPDCVVKITRLTLPADPPGDLPRHHGVARGVTGSARPASRRNLPPGVSCGGA